MDKQRTVKVAEKYSDLIITQPDAGQLLTRPYMRGSVPLDLSQYKFNVPGRIKPLILHAPSVPEAKGVAKVDSIIIIFVYTLIMLSSCVIVGISGLITILGWGYAILFILPFLVLLLGRDWLDKLRQKYYPESSPLPSILASLKALLLGVLVWVITSSCFAWLLYASKGSAVIPFWTVVGAYATGYLGGYISIFVPSGLGVSEGLVALMLGPYIGTHRILAVAISFRIIHTFIVWCNILLSVILTSRQAGTRIIH